MQHGEASFPVQAGFIALPGEQLLPRYRYVGPHQALDGGDVQVLRPVHFCQQAVYAHPQVLDGAGSLAGGGGGEGGQAQFGQGIGGAGAHIVNAVIAPAPHRVAGQKAQRTAAAVAAAHHQGVVSLVDQQALVVVHQLVRRALKQDMALGVHDLAPGVHISGLRPGHRSGGPGGDGQDQSQG